MIECGESFKECRGYESQYLQVSVQNVLLVQILQGKKYLYEPIQNLLLVQVFSCLSLPLKAGIEIASLAVFHDDTEVVTSAEGLVVLHNVGMIQRR